MVADATDSIMTVYTGTTNSLLSPNKVPPFNYTLYVRSETETTLLKGR